MHRHLFLNSFNTILLFVICLCCWTCNPQNSSEGSENNTDIHNISSLIKQAKSKDLDASEKRLLLDKAYQLNTKIRVDSVKNKNLLDIAYAASKLNDTSFFKQVNSEALELSLKLKDTFGIGDTHWNFGAFYAEKEALDSAYYHFSVAHKRFETIRHDRFAARMLFNMAYVQGQLKNHTGSEILTFHAIKKYELIGDYEALYRCYNRLGIIYKNLHEYDKSIEYYFKAMSYLEKVDKKGTFKEGLYNNIGLVYHYKGEYGNAIRQFSKALKRPDLKTENINLYARLIDNLTYSRFLNNKDESDIEENFLKSFKIRDSLNNVSGIIMCKLHLSEYYAYKGDTLRAIEGTREALKLSRKVNNNRDWLVSLQLLSEIDKNNAESYLVEYVKLSDSLQNQERTIRNKFTRIQYETDQYIEETERLTTQNTLITIIGLISVLSISLLYLIKVQRSKNKELKLEKEQQKANEEIYQLMMKQQSKLEEGRLEERSRISEELHDGVLGRIFGTRVGLGFLSLNGDEDALKKYKFFMEEMQDIEKEIRDLSHDLKNEILSSRYDFIAIIDQYVGNLCDIQDVDYTIDTAQDIRWNTMSDKLRVNVFRITQESVQNTLKHAKASHINIVISIKKGILNLTIEDDGIGFDIHKTHKGIGLKNIDARVKKLGGSMSITSRVNKGVIVAVNLPITN